MSNLRKLRNKAIVDMIKKKIDQGFKVKDSIKLTAKVYFLSSATVKDIYYNYKKEEE